MREKVIGIIGTPDAVKHKYIKHLKFFINPTFKEIISGSKISSLDGIIILEYSDNLLWKIVEEDVPILLEIPFAKTLRREVALLEELVNKDVDVLLPLISRHHPKLVKLRSFILQGLLGKLASIHLSMNVAKGCIRREPSGDFNIPGELTHLLLNIVDYFQWISSTEINDITGWIIDDERKMLIVNAKFGGSVASAISYLSEGACHPSGVDVILEATGFERLLTWDDTEQTLLLRGDNEIKHVWWSADFNEIIARHFIELLDHGSAKYPLKEVASSYKFMLKVLKELRLHKKEGES